MARSSDGRSDGPGEGATPRRRSPRSAAGGSKQPGRRASAAPRARKRAQSGAGAPVSTADADGPATQLTAAVSDGPDTDPDGLVPVPGRWDRLDDGGGAAGVGAGLGAGPRPTIGAASGPVGVRKPRTTGVAAAAAANSVGRGTAIRNRILPRSVLGIASLILAFAIGAGLSGVVLFSYYQYKLNQTNDRVNTLVTGYKKQFANAEGDLSATVAAAKLNIDNQLKALEQLQAGPATLAALVKQVAPSVFFVHTLDASGQPSVGTAFVVSSDSTQSLLLTSYTTVQAATASPGPAVYVQQGNTSTVVTVRQWDPQYDLALLVLPAPNLPALTAALPTPAPQPGSRIYAVSGLGTAGASITQGSIIDVSASGVAVDAAIAPAFQGGPLINDSGQVLAVASRTYAPLGFTSEDVWYAPYVEAACNKVLVCPGGTLVGSH